MHQHAQILFRLAARSSILPQTPRAHSITSACFPSVITCVVSFRRLYKSSRLVEGRQTISDRQFRYET